MNEFTNEIKSKICSSTIFFSSNIFVVSAIISSSLVFIISAIATVVSIVCPTKIWLFYNQIFVNLVGDDVTWSLYSFSCFSFSYNNLI